jgi:hypothetical protein
MTDNPLAPTGLRGWLLKRLGAEDSQAVLESADRIFVQVARLEEAQGTTRSGSATGASRGEPGSAAARLAALAGRLESLADDAQRRDRDDHTPPPPPPPPPPPQRDFPYLPAVAERLISLRDRLALNAGQAPSVGWLDREAVAALQESGVSQILDDGPVDPNRHEVVDVRITADPRLNEHIAATARPGYMAEEHIVRSQQVVAWVMGDGAETPDHDGDQAQGER